MSAPKSSPAPAAAASSKEPEGKVQSAAFLALKAKNKALKAELAKLEKLSASVENKDSKAKTEKKVKDVTAVKAAFDHFDADRSGFIDKAEFAQLSADLGELLDDEELSDAVKEIDSSGDGKISFNEFIRWWTSDKKSSNKSAAKIALLKTKLKAREFKAAGHTLIRQLSAIKPQDNEFVKHRITFSVGDFKEAKASLNAAVNFNPASPAQLMGAPAAVHLKLALNADATPEKVEPERKVVEEFLKAIGLPFKVETDMKARELTVSVAAPEDPFALAGQMGLDLKTFVKELSVALEVPVSPAEVLDANDTRPIADLIGVRFDTKLEFRKALVHTLAATLPGAQDAAAAAFLENFNLALTLGNVKDVLASMLPPAGLNPAHAGAALPPQLMQFAKVAKFLTKDGSRQKMIDKYLELCTAAQSEPEARSLLAAARAVVDQLTQISFVTASGVNVVVDLKNVLPIKAIPPPAAAGAVAKAK